MVTKSKTNKIKKFTYVATNAGRVGIFLFYEANLALGTVEADKI